MKPIEAIVEDLVAVLSPQDLAFALELGHTTNIQEQTLQYLDERNINTPEALCHWIEKEFGKLYIRKILKHLAIETNSSLPTRAMVETWLEFRKLTTLRPRARPIELTRIILELTQQTNITPEKFDAIDLLADRIRRLLLYLAYFYSGSLLHSTEDTHTEDASEILANLDLQELCELIQYEEPVSSTPYRADDNYRVQLADANISNALKRLSLLLSNEHPNRESTSRDFTECVTEILNFWNQQENQAIPKGAVVAECKMSSFTSRLDCYDEFNESLTLNGVRAPVAVGSSVLLCPRESESTWAPKLEPVPECELWTTPAATSSTAPAHLKVEMRTAEARPRPGRKTIFLSYSSADAAWAERVTKHLQPLARSELANIFDTKKIQAGDLWKETEREALRDSAIAIPLISVDFFASNSITTLPELIKAAKAEKLKLIPVFLRHVYLDKEHELNRHRGANDPSTPLENLPAGEQEQLLANLAKNLRRMLGPS